MLFFLTANNVLAQSVISSCSVNIGEASIERTETYYPFIQKLNYLKFSKAAKERYIFFSALFIFRTWFIPLNKLPTSNPPASSKSLRDICVISKNWQRISRHATTEMVLSKTTTPKAQLQNPFSTRQFTANSYHCIALWILSPPLFPGNFS